MRDNYTTKSFVMSLSKHTQHNTFGLYFDLVFCSCVILFIYLIANILSNAILAHLTVCSSTTISLMGALSSIDFNVL